MYISTDGFWADFTYVQVFSSVLNVSYVYVCVCVCMYVRNIFFYALITFHLPFLIISGFFMHTMKNFIFKILKWISVSTLVFLVYFNVSIYSFCDVQKNFFNTENLNVRCSIDVYRKSNKSCYTYTKKEAHNFLLSIFLVFSLFSHLLLCFSNRLISRLSFNDIF